MAFISIPLWLQLVSAFFAGVLLGGFFFGGLWWTARRLAGAKRPALLISLSFLLRTAAVLAVLYLLLRAATPWPALAALAGFTVVRMLLFFIARPPRQAAPASPEKKGGRGDGR